MKKYLFILALFACSNLFAQEFITSNEYFFTNTNSWDRRSILSFANDEKGLYVENNTVSEKLERIDGVPYAYDKSTNRLYVKSKHSNNYVILKDHAIKFYKKKDNILKIKNKELEEKINSVNIELREEHNKLNEEIKRDIAKKQEEKRIKDSLENVRLNNEMVEYRKSNNWKLVPIGGEVLYCTDCKESIGEKYIWATLIRNDSVYFMTLEKGFLDLEYTKFHVAKLNSNILNNNDFKKHFKAFKDSLSQNSNLYDYSFVEVLNKGSLHEYVQSLKKKAPYGFISKWGLSLNSAEGIEPYFSFFNMSNKTIKYVDFYFSVFNDVGDRCYLRYDGTYLGKVRGVGPVESYESGSWNWDSAVYYTSPDASEMRIMKLVLTYMDGTTRTIPKAQVIIN